MILELVTRVSLAFLPSLTTTPLVAAPVAVAKLNAGTAIAEVQKRYANVTQITVGFRQSVTNVTFGVTKASEGQLRLLRPDRMRWDYVKPGSAKLKKTFVSNGKTLHVVDHDNMEVIKKRLGDDLLPVVVAFLYGKGDLKSAYHAALDASAKYGGKDDIVLKLTPKRPSAQYKTLYLVATKDYRVTQSVVIDASGNINHFFFDEPDLAKVLDAGLFELDTKATRAYRIIDADAPPPER